MNYAEAKEIANKLMEECKVLSEVFQDFPRGAFNLVTDEAKASQSYKDANKAYIAKFTQLRNFNSFFVKTYKKEIAAERKARFA